VRVEVDYADAGSQAQAFENDALTQASSPTRNNDAFPAEHL
jgi:hypothetical protein